jgi:hypothetical protein
MGLQQWEVIVEYKVGDKIRYVDFAGERRLVRVTEMYDDIKNGRPGFDGLLLESWGGVLNSEYKKYTEVDAVGVWGYDDQIVATYPRWQ